MTIIKARMQAAVSIQQALDARIEYLKTLPAYKTLKSRLLEWEANAPGPYYMDGYGEMVSRMDTELSSIFNEDEDGNTDHDIAEQLLRDIFEGFVSLENVGGYWYASQSMGEPCTVTYPPERNCYAVYSTELGLKVNSIKSEEHGLLIVEKAQRLKGYFSSVVSVDSSGECHTLDMSAISVLSDQELDNRLAIIEDENFED